MFFFDFVILFYLILELDIYSNNLFSSLRTYIQDGDKDVRAAFRQLFFVLEKQYPERGARYYISMHELSSVMLRCCSCKAYIYSADLSMSHVMLCNVCFVFVCLACSMRFLAQFSVPLMVNVKQSKPLQKV